jgi:hypothetical protein
MTTKSNYYDHPTYTVRQSDSAGEAGGGATTQYAKFVAFTPTLAYNAVLAVTVAGTSAGALVYVSRISGTATTVLGTATPSTSVAGTVLQIALSTAAGGLTLAQGDILTTVSGADTVGKLAVVYEVSVVPGANITA